MRVLKKNELPYKEAKTYPEFENKDALIMRLREGDANKYIQRWKICKI